MRLQFSQIGLIIILYENQSIIKKKQFLQLLLSSVRDVPDKDTWKLKSEKFIKYLHFFYLSNNFSLFGYLTATDSHIS